jgi:putative ABC transport system permease protein
MIDSLYIAWKYIRYNKIKTGILIGCITLIIVLPLSLQMLLNESERQLMSRAVSTPLVIGAKGSALDLMMNTIYFNDETPETITMQAVDRVFDTDLALAIPLYIRFKARGYPIVGTSLDYFEFRKLQLATGRMMAMLGECVLGANVASQLGLKPGDTIVSSPESLFDIAGIYPLKMTIVGVFAKTHNSDDLGIFVDTKTAWVIQGLCHGHQDVTQTKDSSLVLNRTEGNVAATAKLYQYTEITDENIDSFHFHGDQSNFPLTAVIAVPYDDKSGTLLQGRYLAPDETQMIVKPKDIIDGLLQNIFRIKNVLDAVIALVSMAMVFAILLVFSLSLRLRQREIQTIFKIGCSRWTITKLLAAEILLILIASGIVCSCLMGIVQLYSNDLVRMWFIR